MYDTYLNQYRIKNNGIKTYDKKNNLNNNFSFFHNEQYTDSLCSSNKPINCT